MLDSLTSKLSQLPVAVRAGIALAILGVAPLTLWIVLPRGTIESPAASGGGQQGGYAVSAATPTPGEAAIQEQTQADTAAVLANDEGEPSRTNWPLVWIAWGVWAVAIALAVLASYTCRLWTEMKDAVKPRSA